MTKPCPYCLETIEEGAVKCKHCGEFLDASKAPPQRAAPSVAGVKKGLQCPQCGGTDVKRKTRYLQPAFTILVAVIVVTMPIKVPQFIEVLATLPLWVAGGVALLGKNSCGSCAYQWA